MPLGPILQGGHEPAERARDGAANAHQEHEARALPEREHDHEIEQLRAATRQAAPDAATTAPHMSRTARSRRRDWRRDGARGRGQRPARSSRSQGRTAMAKWASATAPPWPTGTRSPSLRSRARRRPARERAAKAASAGRTALATSNNAMTRAKYHEPARRRRAFRRLRCASNDGDGPAASVSAVTAGGSAAERRSGIGALAASLHVQERLAFQFGGILEAELGLDLLAMRAWSWG